jgi:hypothetical protein
MNLDLYLVPSLTLNVNRPQAKGTSVDDKALYRKDLVRCIGSVAGLQVDLNGVLHTAESQPHVVKHIWHGTCNGCAHQGFPKASQRLPRA